MPLRRAPTAAAVRRHARRGALLGLAGLVAAACSKLAFVAVNVPAAFGAYTRRADIPYAGGNDAAAEHRLDVYLPTVPATGPRPLAVFWYGGRWSSGDKADYRFVGS